MGVGGGRMTHVTKSFRNVNFEVPTGYPGGNTANNWTHRSGDEQEIQIEL